MFFLPIRTIFELNRRIKETNVLTKFHIDWAKMCLKDCSHKTATPPGGHAKNVTSRVGLPIQTIFELNHWTKNVTSRVFTCFHYIHIDTTAPPSGGHVYSPIWTIFKLIRDINKNNVLTKFHDDWAKIVISRVFTMFLHSIIMNTAPPPFRPCINGTNVLTKFHEDRTN
ncbi:hypothetical protein DPMN_046774 [Dreissena polymorpha]|uniref:Uncharacterized protein n=1 Tax=Dreissena polymorpha TaxID=45954 RepID=A0A9D4I0V3_DREPO|nr:hypothetical protein DPMN_046774 [Dreissena polymorpha]